MDPFIDQRMDRFSNLDPPVSYVWQFWMTTSYRVVKDELWSHFWSSNSGKSPSTFSLFLLGLLSLQSEVRVSFKSDSVLA